MKLAGLLRDYGGITALPVDGDAEDVPQAREDFVHNFWVSVGAELGGDDRLLDVCTRQKETNSKLQRSR